MPERVITLLGKYDSLNVIFNNMKFNKFAAQSIVRRNQKQAWLQLRTMEPLPEPADYEFIWHRSNRREDPDNIASAIKYIFDAMQQAKLIHNDNWAAVHSITHRFECDTRPGQEFVEIKVHSE